MTVLTRRTLLGQSLAACGCLAVPPAGAKRAGAARAVERWTFDNLHRIGGHPVEVIGSPKLIASPWGQAVGFDGRQDGLLIPNHPLAGASSFTFEALFRPNGGAAEQRWFHLESDEVPIAEPGKGKTRMLFELRIVGDSWYLDAFMTGAGYRQAMMVPAKTFPVGRWYHVAQSYDGRVYRSYVNGELQMETIMPFVGQGLGRASVGMRMNRVNFFNGAIRQARFTRSALAPAKFLPFG